MPSLAVAPDDDPHDVQPLPPSSMTQLETLGLFKIDKIPLPIDLEQRIQAIVRTELVDVTLCSRTEMHEMLKSDLHKELKNLKEKLKAEVFQGDPAAASPISPGLMMLEESMKSEAMAQLKTKIKAELISELTDVVKKECIPSQQSSAEAPVPRSRSSRSAAPAETQFLSQNTGNSDAWLLRQTCWDAAAFAGHNDVMLLLESVVVTFLCMLSACVQICLIIIVITTLASSPLDQEAIEGLNFWRTSTAHDIAYTNPLTSESLASRVCRGDVSLHVGDRQSNVVHEIQSYLYDNSPFNGVMLCVLAMFIWIITVTKEFKALYSMWRALLSLPTSSKSTFELVGAMRQPRMFSRARLLWIACLSFVEFCIAGTLLLAGLAFLSATYRIEDILLNTVALEFVLHADELLFYTLAPVQTRKMIARMSAIPLPRGWHWHGLDAQMAVNLILCISILWSAVSLRLAPEMEKMRDAYDQLCSGFTDFSYGVGTLRQIVWAPRSSHVNEAISFLKSSRRYKVIREVIANYGSSNIQELHKVPHVFGTGWSVAFITQMSPKSLSKTYFSNRRCTDKIQKNSQTWQDKIRLATLRDAVANQSVGSCSEVARHCSTYGMPGPAVRLFCAATCKCDDPSSSLALPFAADGCPSECSFADHYVRTQAARQCAQPVAGLLANSRFWKEFADARIQASANWSSHQQKRSLVLAERIKLEGCEAILGHRGFNRYCRPHTMLKSLAFWCPLYCSCNSTPRYAECPRNCAVNMAIQFTKQVPGDL